MQCEINHDAFLTAYKNIFLVTNVPKYRSFQFRLLHRAIITNVHLKPWKMREDDGCSFCDSDRETYEHLFVLRKSTQDLWTKFEVEFSFPITEMRFNVHNVLWNQIIPTQMRVLTTLPSFFLIFLFPLYIIRKSKLCNRWRINTSIQLKI